MSAVLTFRGARNPTFIKCGNWITKLFVFRVSTTTQNMPASLNAHDEQRGSEYHGKVNNYMEPPRVDSMFGEVFRGKVVHQKVEGRTRGV